MNFLEFMFVPMILLLVVVAPIWITLHYRSLKNSSRVLSDDDREALDEMLESVDRMTDRITNLEAILDADHPDWRNDKETNR
ncbi:MAG: envelope stress response membrane protein PspB [Luminiphilus sp.]|nr:envelope stress response membrane protein PspB [Pseudomonadales bacterium]MBL6823766.1 envelope stress response membrane protein PspB [Luminiphilus sp.]MDA0891860.1 envelope stress response membrane protein PspB [Pseudomonadota bacterium]RPH11564.1 MAG: envelope stress response membrane protein PspB [Alteromonadaceae bacterium TMED101]CAI8339323.1 MAG: Phage shock protein B [Halieaceae bacterium]